MSPATPPPPAAGGSGGAGQPGGAGGGWSPSPTARDLPPPYVPLPGPGGGQGGLLHPSAALRRMRSELQRRRTLVILLFLVVAVSIIDYGPEPPQVRLNQACKTTIVVQVPFRWTESSEERINTIFDSKPLYYRQTPINAWIGSSLKDLYAAIDLYHPGMPAQAFEDAVRDAEHDHALLQPRFARSLFRYLEERHAVEPDHTGAESESLKTYLEVQLLGKLAKKSDYFLDNRTKEFESKRTKASEFKIIRENELDLIARDGRTPDNYPALPPVSKEGWINNWRLHEDLDPELKRWLADGVSAGAFDDDMKESLYEYFTGYAFKRDSDAPAGGTGDKPHRRNLGPTLELLGFDNDPASFPKPPDSLKDRPKFPGGDAPAGAPEPALPAWDLANYYLKEYVKQKLGREVLYTPPPANRDPGTPLSEENVLVTAGTTITPKILDLLWEHARNVKEHATALQNVLRLGRHTLAALISLLFFIVVLHYAAPASLRELKKIFNLMLVALAVLGTAKVLNYLAPSAPQLLGQLVMATPIVLLGMIATIAFNETVAVVAVAAIALLAGYLSGGGFTAEGWHYIIPLTLGGWTGMIGVRQTRTQGKYLVAGFVGGSVQGLSALLFELPQQNFGADWLNGVLPWAGDWIIPSLLQGLVSGMIVAAFLKLIEGAFDVLTPLGLLELNDDQHPALRRIATYANGTYAHSKAVGLLSEAAAESIKADVLLVRVGVAFHDLGKTARPDEYIENNPAAHSLHDNRDPMQSAQIIIAHVHDGIQMAKQYRLPQRVIDFIPQHHGNDMVKFFYHKARRLTQEHGDDPDSVSESAFRYPGPKPQSREAAVVMMADTIDAASRTLTDPTPEKLRTFTHNLMMDKLGSGQLDECGLTFQDMSLCEDAFLRVLAARYHQRIRYPGQELTEGDDLAGSTVKMQKSRVGGLPAGNIMPVLIDAPTRKEAPAGTPPIAGSPNAPAAPETAAANTGPAAPPPTSSPAAPAAENSETPPTDAGSAGSGSGGGGASAIPSPRRRLP